MLNHYNHADPTVWQILQLLKSETINELKNKYIYSFISPSVESLIKNSDVSLIYAELSAQALGIDEQQL